VRFKPWEPVDSKLWNRFPSDKEYKCNPRRRSRKEREPCMVTPLLGVEDFRLLITGSRKWKDWDAMQEAFDELNDRLQQEHPGKRVVVVHGAARGADVMAARMGSARYGWVEEPHPALWSIYGKKAGSRRNQHMVSLGADLCYAFPLRDSIGTRHCMSAAARTGIRVEVIEPWHELERLARKGLTDPPRLEDL